MDSAPRVKIGTTAHGVRGLFATTTIPAGTVFHTCTHPYLYVIYRAFRREVCAFCFAYAFSAGKNTWNIRLDPRFSSAGVWFCSDGCKDSWMSEFGLAGASMAAKVGLALERASSAQSSKSRAGDGGHVKGKDGSSRVLSSSDISQKLVDESWALARTDKKVPSLEEMELDIARFAAQALVRRYIENTIRLTDQQIQSTQTILPEYSTWPSASPSPQSWTQFMDLQNNELRALRARPHLLATQIKAYKFLRAALSSIPELAVYLKTEETVRSVLSRDHANAFGLWEGGGSSPEQDSDREMFGWGMYVSASYFNHSCSANVIKRAQGRSLQFIPSSDVQEGEELCISYCDTNASLEDRQKALKDSWFFSCLCQKCQEGR